MQPQTAVVLAAECQVPYSKGNLGYVLESFMNEETKVPISFRDLSPPDISLSGPQNKNVVHNSIPRIL
jgi:hypothetical protein